MSAIASPITSLTIVCSTVYSRRRSKKTSKLRVTGLCEGNSSVIGEFPAQRASNAENVSIWWRHHIVKLKKDNPYLALAGKLWLSLVKIVEQADRVITRSHCDLFPQCVLKNTNSTTVNGTLEIGEELGPSCIRNIDLVDLAGDYVIMIQRTSYDIFGSQVFSFDSVNGQVSGEHKFIGPSEMWQLH